MRAKRARKILKLTCCERICYNIMRAKRAGKIKIELSRAKQAEFFFASKLKSDYFSFQKMTDYLFPAFSRSEYLFPKSASPPPPESNCRPLTNFDYYTTT